MAWVSQLGALVAVFAHLHLLDNLGGKYGVAASMLAVNSAASRSVQERCRLQQNMAATRWQMLNCDFKTVVVRPGTSSTSSSWNHYSRDDFDTALSPFPVVSCVATETHISSNKQASTGKVLFKQPT